METTYILYSALAFLMLICGLVVGFKLADLLGKKKSEQLIKKLNKERQDNAELWREKQWLAEEVSMLSRKPDLFKPGWTKQ